MIDSCNPRKLDPGFAKRYSKPSDLITSTMKSEPVRSVVSTSKVDGVSASATGDIAGGGPARRTSGGSASAALGAATNAAAPAAALFRKLRRLTGFFGDFAMSLRLHLRFVST